METAMWIGEAAASTGPFLCAKFMHMGKEE
jgi:hypothetical protein